MYYVVQVTSGKEQKTLRLIDALVDDGLVREAFTPKYRIKKRFQGQWREVCETLLPGYVFVVTRHPDKLRQQLSRVPEFTKLLAYNDTFIPAQDEEMRFIDAFTNPGERTIGMSEGAQEGDRIIVTAGPLVGQTSWIKKIDRRKKLAYLEIEILGRRKTVRVGIDVVSRKRDAQPGQPAHS